MVKRPAMDDQGKRFDDLWARVEGDTGAVRPLGSPWRRSLVLVVWAALSLVVVLLSMGLREDCSTLGAGLSWVPSCTALALGYLLFWFAGRESIPGDGIRPFHAVFWSVVACSAHLGISHLTYEKNPLTVPAEGATQIHVMCIAATLIIGTPLILLGITLARRGLLIRPWVAGLLLGVSAGVVADAVWRLHCPYSGPDHFLLAHTGPYLALIVIGLVFLRRRSPRIRRSKEVTASER